MEERIEKMKEIAAMLDKVADEGNPFASEAVIYFSIGFHAAVDMIAGNDVIFNEKDAKEVSVALLTATCELATILGHGND